METCSLRNIPFLGRIATGLLDISPEMMVQPEKRSYHVFWDKFWVWICWDNPDLPPVILISNFHKKAKDAEDCAILMLYNKFMYGSEIFDRATNVYEHEPNMSPMNIAINSVLNAIVLNTKVVSDQKQATRKWPTESFNLFQHFLKIILTYSVSDSGRVLDFISKKIEQNNQPKKYLSVSKGGLFFRGIIFNQLSIAFVKMGSIGWLEMSARQLKTRN